MKKWGHLFRSYGHSNVKNCSFFVFLVVTAKKSASAWTKYIHTSEISYSALSENAMDSGILSYLLQDGNP